MVYYLKLDQKTWGAGDYVADNTLALTGTIYSDEALSSAVNISSYTLKIKVYPRERPDWYQLSEDADIVSGSDGTYKIQLDNDTTTSLDDGRYVYDIEILLADSTVEKVHYGIITVNPQATK